MRVLMLTCNNSLMDGINRHILAVAPALNKLEEVEVAVCVTFPQGELQEALAKEGVKIYSLNCPHGHAISIFWRFWKVMRDFMPDVVHGHVISLFVGMMLRFCFNHVKLITTIHGISDTVKKRDVWSKFVRPRVDFHCYISKGVQNALRGTKQVSQVVYNPVSHVEEAVAQTHPLTVGTACRIADVKQPLVFTEVMIRVLQQVPECRAMVCGDDQGLGLLAQMRQMIHAANLGERFHLLGYRADAPQLMRELSCFVLTSSREGMPTALLEAMSVNVPVAFMKGEGGLVDLAEMNQSEHPYAIVVEQGNIDGMAQKIIALLQNPDQAKLMTSQAQTIIKKFFTTDAVAKQLHSIYRTVGGGGG